VLVGVGDGPWEDMKKFDDKLPARDFDNFQVRVTPSKAPHYNKKNSEEEDRQPRICMSLVTRCDVRSLRVQFVNFTSIMSRDTTPQQKESAFALAALMEVPIQYKATMELGMLGYVRSV
jgi:E3 ubiquitin-protein ligase RGLG